MKLLLTPLLAALFCCQAAVSIGEVDFRLGSLNVKNRELKKWTELDEGDPVKAGDTLRTGKESRCEVKLKDGSLIRLSQNTTYLFGSLEKGKTTSFRGTLLKGETWTNVNKKSAKDFKVNTPVAVAAVIGTVYKMEYDGSLSEVTVMEGEVGVNLNQELQQSLKKSASLEPKEISGPKEVRLEDWIKIVRGDLIAVRQDGTYEKSKVSPEELDREWEEFKESAPEK